MRTFILKIQQIDFLSRYIKNLQYEKFLTTCMCFTYVAGFVIPYFQFRESWSFADFISTLNHYIASELF